MLPRLCADVLAGVVAGVLSHMVASEQLNPQWVERQEKTNMAVSRIAAQTEAVISEGIMAAYSNREAMIDKIMDEGSRARLGIDYYVNPATGQQYVVSNTQNYYWSDAQGRVVGTATDTPPARVTPDCSAFRRNKNCSAPSRTALLTLSRQFPQRVELPFAHNMHPTV